MVLALTECSSIRKFVVTDERGAGFAALGAARETGVPTLLVCTSGTAAANYLPAVVEASLAAIPLIVITADRPAEARDVRAAQTIEQRGIYRNFVRWEVDLPVPTATTDLGNYLRSTAARAWATAVQKRGPVHLNMGFREPLYDVNDIQEAQVPHDEPTPPAPQIVGAAAPSLTSEDLAALATNIAIGTRGVIVVGSGLYQQPGLAGLTGPAAVVALARRLGWPVLADPLSGLRSAGLKANEANVKDVKDIVIDAYDLCLRDANFVASHEPEFVLRLGQIPASKPLARALTVWTGAHHIVIADHDWPDPDYTANTMVRADPIAACTALLVSLRDSGHDNGRDSDHDNDSSVNNSIPWQDKWAHASAAIRSHLDTDVQDAAANFPGRLCVELVNALPDNASLTVGNSMPIRDIETFVGQTPRACTITANRGANGIDGVVSTAIGAALAGQRPSALLIGDQSFLHDLSAIAWPALREAPLVIVVHNDDGGGIFEQLPQRELGGTFETYFAAPHGQSPAGLAAAAGINAVCLGDDLTELRSALHDGFSRISRGEGPTLIEVTSNRDNNRNQRQSFVKRALEATIGSQDEPALTTTSQSQQPGGGWSRVHKLNHSRGTIAYRRQSIVGGAEHDRPLLALHGFLGSSATWTSIASALNGKRSLLAPDLPGHGDCNFGNDAPDHTMLACFELIDAILDEEHISQADLLGYSMGGRVALRYALARPERVGKIILESTSWGIDDPIERRDRLRKDEAAAINLEHESAGSGAEAGMKGFVDAWQRLPLFSDQRQWPASRQEEQRQVRLQQAPNRIAASLRGMGAGADASVQRQLQTLNRPVALICGEFDEKYCALADQMASLLPSAKLLRFAQAGHNVHAADSAAFTTAVLSFLAEDEPTAGANAHAKQ